MGKRNKITYTAEVKTPKLITLTGRVYLQYLDDDMLSEMRKGDLLLHAECKQLHTNHMAQYQLTGFTGYFRVDVHDGAEWRPVILNEIFLNREHHFSKTERSMDTYVICKDILTALAGKNLSRTYREHYEYLEE